MCVGKIKYFRDLYGPLQFEISFERSYIERISLSRLVIDKRVP